MERCPHCGRRIFIDFGGGPFFWGFPGWGWGHHVWGHHSHGGHGHRRQ
ncbi:MAG: hypothetical protein H6Q68_2894 [Firmicutes bacterium]|nr:hypothetical protein [Bacillota bacterium]